MPGLNKNGDLWERFCAARPDYLNALAETVERGFVRRDTTHQAFCGCVDWHSSVHGAYALLAASRLTGQPRWAEVVESALTHDRLEAEMASLYKGQLDHELPYGFSWFLKLAQEWEQGWGRGDLLPLATEMALRLGQWLFSLSEEAVVHHVRRPEYGNLSWPVLNLWHWWMWKQDAERLERLSEFTRLRLLPLDTECPASLDRATDEFFPAALHRCRTLITILPPEETRKWLARHQHTGESLVPLTTFPRVHSAGLNFSRSWGLWALYRSLGNGEFRNQYVNHIVSHMDMPQYWRDDYRRHAHWVPQFGIYAIALSMQDDPV